MHPEAFSIAFLALIAITIAETVLAARWNRAYFRSGLLIFRQRIGFVGAIQSLPAAAHLDALLKGRWGPSLLFRELSPGELAFREALFEFRLLSYTPIMHGHIEALPAELVVLVEGRLNWSTLGFVLMIALVLDRASSLVFLPFFVVVVGLIYLIQALRYRRVTTALVEARAADA
jgi:hypothetical protein